jgi:hypothetical protein
MKSDIARDMFDWSLKAMVDDWDYVDELLGAEDGPDDDASWGQVIGDLVHSIVKEYEREVRRIPSTQEYPRWWHIDRLSDMVFNNLA